jgi:asparagine synthetase B (glutamine-hydrolysing)
MAHSPLLPSDPNASSLLGVHRVSAHQRRLDLGSRNNRRDLSRGRLMTELDERLRDAVRSRLPRDGEVAVLATGGLDSSVVAAIARG